jgi:hypothetical protein
MKHKTSYRLLVSIAIAAAAVALALVSSVATQAGITRAVSLSAPLAGCGAVSCTTYLPLVVRDYPPPAPLEVTQAVQQPDNSVPLIADRTTFVRFALTSTVAHTSLALYQAMKAHGKTAREAGQVIYAAVVASVSQLPPRPYTPPSPEFIAQEKELALRSQERCYSEDWVWEFVKGDGREFDYGYDFLECGALKLYHAHAAGEFLPFFCYLDFVTHRTVGQGFVRTTTLAEGHEKCDFRWNKGGETKKGWPPPFLK